MIDHWAFNSSVRVVVNVVTNGVAARAQCWTNNMLARACSHSACLMRSARAHGGIRMSVEDYSHDYWINQLINF